MTAYVNGQKVGNVRGSNTPLLCDITSALKPGENQILLVVRDALAVMDPAYVNPKNPVIAPDYLDVPVLLDNTGLLGVDKVTLKAAPLVSAEDLLVNTSVRNKDITARFTVVNREADAKRLKVKASILDAGQPVMEVGSETIDLASGESQEVKIAAPWSNPVLWGPDSPKLYAMAIEVSDAASGRQLDFLRERFGFRECWVQGNRLMFNGRPIRLKGSNCFGGGGIPGAEDGVQWTRGSAGNEDYMDEFGVLSGLYILGGLGNASSSHNSEREVFWKNENRNVVAGMKQYLNHPCLIAWDLANEWNCDPYNDDPLSGARRLQKAGEAVLAYDPSRLVIFDGCGDLMGLWNINVGHYPSKFSGQYLMDGHSSYLPDSCYWRPLGQDFKPGEDVQAWLPNPKAFYRPGQTSPHEHRGRMESVGPPAAGIHDARRRRGRALARPRLRQHGRLVLEAERRRPARPRLRDDLQLHRRHRTEPPRDTCTSASSCRITSTISLAAGSSSGAIRCTTTSSRPRISLSAGA